MHVLNLSIDDVNINEGALELLKHIKPEWSSNLIEIKEFTDGITNRLLGCYLKTDPNNIFLIRLYGQNTDLIIDRASEVATMKKLSSIGCAAPLYATFKNGICYGYIPGETLDVNSVRDFTVVELLTQLFVKIHRLTPENGENTIPLLFPVLKKYFHIIPTSFVDQEMNKRFKQYIPSKVQLGEELKLLEEHLLKLGSPVVFCHNDALLKNIIYDKDDNKIAFIDYEYAGYNYQAFDIANHFCEFAGIPDTDFSRYPDKDFQFKWLRRYLQFWEKKDFIRESEIERLYVQVNKFALASNFMWGLWGLVQAANSSIDFDFLGFSIVRFDEYFHRKEEFFSLQFL